MTYGLAFDILPLTRGAGGGFTGTTVPPGLFEMTERELQSAMARNIVNRRLGAVPSGLYREFPPIRSDQTHGEKIFGAIQALYLSTNRPRDRQIAERLTALNRDANEEGECIVVDSLEQFTDFFLSHGDLGFPKITLTPDGTIRARWIHGPGDFAAIEFTGHPLVRLIAEIPRDNDLTARHFTWEPVHTIVRVARAVGASFS